MKILVCDDHPVVCDGLKNDVREMMSGCNTVAYAENGTIALEMIESGQYDIVIMDIKLPGRNGLEILKIMQKQWPHLPVFMLSAYEEDVYAFEACQLGAKGYFSKSTPPHELIHAMQNAGEEKKYFSLTVLQMADDASKAKKKQHAKYGHDILTDYQVDLMIMFCQGHSQEFIAKKMKREIGTISSHKSKIKVKMGFADDNEMFRYCKEHYPHLL